jgi:hypothetical protein
MAAPVLHGWYENDVSFDVDPGCPVLRSIKAVSFGQREQSPAFTSVSQHKWLKTAVDIGVFRCAVLCRRLTIRKALGPQLVRLQFVDTA